MQYSIAVCHDLLRTLFASFDRLPAPAAAVLLIAVGVCVFQSLGNSKLAPWRP